MHELKGRTAVVTGAASGIGLGMARAFAAEGMAVALCDIRAEPLAAAVKSLEDHGARVVGIETDVSDRAAVERAADAAESAFGDIHVVCNNAGVTMKGFVDEIVPNDWDWVIGVNLYGVINGIGVFVPRIKRHGAGGHIVNTASMAGFQVNPQLRGGAYAMTKYAVVALSEALALSLENTGIGVSLLAPAAVDTHIYATADSRPARFGGPHERPETSFMAELLKDGLSGDQVGERVVQAIKADEFFVFTHLEPRAWIEARHRRLMDAFDRAETWVATQRPGARSGG